MSAASLTPPPHQKSLTWTPSQDLATELSKITSELTEAEDKKGSNTSELRRIEDQLRKLGQDGIHMVRT